MDVPYRLLPDTCTIKLPTVGQDATFAETTNFTTTLYSSVPCRVTSKGSDYMVGDLRHEGLVTHIIQIPTYQTDGTTAYSVGKGTQIVVGSATYETLGPARDSSAMGCLQRIEVEVKT